MTVAVLKEIKNNENRVALTPQGVKELVAAGVEVIVQESAGEGSGFPNSEYEEAGATLIASPEEIIEKTDVIVKVKEPIPSEYDLLRKFAGKTLFTYLHLSGVDPVLTDVLQEADITSIAYETVKDEQGKLPLLAPMSEVAGVLAVQYGAEYLQKKYNGKGLTLGKITGVEPAKVVVVGGGYVGATAAKTAAGMGAKVKIFDISAERVAELNQEVKEYLGPVLGQNFEAVVPADGNFEEAIKEADVAVGAVLVAGAKAPEVITEEHVKSMQKGSVIVDVSIDQGGCVWGSKATTHSEPTYEIDGKIFCCVANMPGQVSRQSTLALTNATLPYLKKIATEGAEAALKSDSGFLEGLNVYKGKVTYESVAKDLGKDYTPAAELL